MCAHIFFLSKYFILLLFSQNFVGTVVDLKNTFFFLVVLFIIISFLIVLNGWYGL